MRNVKVGRYYGRKPYEKLSIRQKRRINCRIENNLSSKRSLVEDSGNTTEHTYQNICEQFTNNYSFNHGQSFENILMDLSSSDNDSNDTDNVIDDTDDNNDNQVTIHDRNDTIHDHFIDGKIWKEILAECFVINNISLKQGDEILKVLRMHSCFSNLPKCCKTLIQTPRDPVEIIALEPGKYLHFHIEKIILDIVSYIPLTKMPTALILDFSTDGISLYKASNVVLWPIYIRIINITFSKPALVGIYMGRKKPNDAMAFFNHLFLI